MGVSVICCQSASEASFRNPVRSGSRSISEAITAGSILRCWLVVVEARHSMDLRDFDTVVCRTSRCPMSFEANQGQTDRQVSFLTRGPGYALFLTPNEAVLSLETPAALTPSPLAPA